MPSIFNDIPQSFRNPQYLQKFERNSEVYTAIFQHLVQQRVSDPRYFECAFEAGALFYSDDISLIKGVISEQFVKIIGSLLNSSYQRKSDILCQHLFCLLFLCPDDNDAEKINRYQSLTHPERNIKNLFLLLREFYKIAPQQGAAILAINPAIFDIILQIRTDSASGLISSGVYDLKAASLLLFLTQAPSLELPESQIKYLLNFHDVEVFKHALGFEDQPLSSSSILEDIKRTPKAATSIIALRYVDEKKLITPEQSQMLYQDIEKSDGSYVWRLKEVHFLKPVLLAESIVGFLSKQTQSQQLQQPEQPAQEVVRCHCQSSGSLFEGQSSGEAEAHSQRPSS